MYLFLNDVANFHTYIESNGAIKYGTHIIVAQAMKKSTIKEISTFDLPWYTQWSFPFFMEKENLLKTKTKKTTKK